MALYDKPVRLLFKDMVDVIDAGPDDIVTREQVFSWFHTKYPKVKDGTIAAHLLKMSTNAPSRVHYNVSSQGEDDLLYQIDSQRFRLYDPSSDPPPIYTGDVAGKDLGAEEVEPEESREFAYERDLQHYLANNLSLIGPNLRLYQEEDITGIEFPVGNRRIDLLAIDGDGDYVVIELKVSRGYDRVVGQLLRYMAWIRKYQADEGQSVRGVIVAREISDDLLLACSELDNVDLYEYELSVSLHKIGVQ